jgi:alpha-L-fucosidase 2
MTCLMTIALRRTVLLAAAAFCLAQAAAQVPGNQHPIRIGVDQAGGNRFGGEIAVVRLYDRALSTKETTELLAAGHDGKAPAAVVWRKGDAEALTNALPLGATGGSIEAWIRPDGSAGRIVDKITPGGVDGFLLDTHPGNAIRLIVGADQMSVPVSFTGQWVHVVASIEAAGGLSLFIDGKRHGVGAAPDGLIYSGRALPPDSPLTLWYTRPATRWTEASVIGNGRLGGMVWGGAVEERIDLNEDTLWSGEPYDNLNPSGLAALPEIRRLLREGKNGEAQGLVEQKMNGRYNQSYQPLGEIEIAFPIAGEILDYRRELSLDEAVARVQFVKDGVRFTRQVLASQPAQAIIVEIAADRPGQVSFSASLASQLHGKVEAGADFLRFAGRCQAHADPSYVGQGERWEDGPDGRGMRFEMRLAARHNGGQITILDKSITAERCDSVTLVLVAATSYNGPRKSPSREGRDPAALCDAYLAPIAGKTFDELRAEHVADHQKLFRRVELDLGRGADGSSALPTNIRLKRFTADSDPSLAALYYQFGRYLLIASSRPGTQPANLQGIWNHQKHPPWSANWTLNCNAQINYWPVEAANLAECHLPLIELARELSVDGAHVAEKLYGAKGWTAHHNTDLWRQAGPVSGSACWSIFQVGGAWLCQHVWEHYAFTQDREYLRDAWPILREAARFFLTGGLMEEPSHGWLVTGPDVNFENGFRKPDGSGSCTCMGPTASMQMVRQLFLNCVEASRILGVDGDFRAEVEAALPRLAPMQVSPTDGMLQEWPEDWKRTAACQVLSSWGLICCNQIDPRHTPELAAALRKIWDTENHWARGSVGSWQGAFPAMVYARLGAGDNVAEILRLHLTRIVNPNLSASFGGMAEWEIDGNLGLTAAIGETLVQSQEENAECGMRKDESNLSIQHSSFIISLLPALPKAWPTGSVKGLKARGNFTVDLAWKDGKVTSYRIASPKPQEATVRVNGETKIVKSEQL